jgi:hypothetical protein
MLRRIVFVLFIIAMSITTTVPVLADAPAQGLVVEGQSVPGIALGFRRAEVEAAYGTPAWCQSVEVPGDFASCTFQVDGGGQVSVRYWGADGGYASNSPDDVAYHIRWSELASGWTTTAGVNTTLARTNPDAVIAAYPNAQVTYNQWGAILQVKDYSLGIQVNWAYDFYTGLTTISMAISAPSTPPPPREALTRVTEIELTAHKSRGRRRVTALVRVQDDLGLAASGAAVSATWRLPDGSTMAVEDITSSSGYAFFEIRNVRRGTYRLIIADVVLAEHQFDAANSVLRASVTVR